MFRLGSDVSLQRGLSIVGFAISFGFASTLGIAAGMWVAGCYEITKHSRATYGL